MKSTYLKRKSRKQAKRVAVGVVALVAVAYVGVLCVLAVGGLPVEFNAATALVGL